MNKYCPSCGAKTFIETDDYDCDAGDKWSCLSCGAQYWMSEDDEIEVTVEGAPKVPYSPIKSDIEVMMERACTSMMNQFAKYSENRQPLVDKWKEDSDAYKGDTIKFRRYAPLNPPPEGTDQSQGENK
ncbi:MAG: hypothetical protein WC455_23870 [Dehalococcoidia bacterium]|jgi:hypothetical protein